MRPSRSSVLPVSGRPAVASSSRIWVSVAPSKTAVAALIEVPVRRLCSCSAQPRWVSRIWPMFMRLGTPSGLRMMSTGVPSGRKGMSSWGRILATTPLLPWRPAILSPTEILRLAATLTRMSRLTPGSSSSPASRLKTRTSTTLPRSPCGRRRLESFTSRAFSPKMARRRRSSAVSSVSPLGVILPTRMSPGWTSAPM